MTGRALLRHRVQGEGHASSWRRDGSMRDGAVRWHRTRHQTERESGPCEKRAQGSKLFARVSTGCGVRGRASTCNRRPGGAMRGGSGEWHAHLFHKATHLTGRHECQPLHHDPWRRRRSDIEWRGQRRCAERDLPTHRSPKHCHSSLLRVYRNAMAGSGTILRRGSGERIPCHVLRLRWSLQTLFEGEIER